MHSDSHTPDLYQVTLASIGDAVITTDNVGNVTFLNHVAETLTGWTIADAAGRPLTEVFRIVNETTREPVANPGLRALEGGHVVGLANHTVLIARDGREYPIDDSAAPIKAAAGTVSGAVLVFRDITERKDAERELRDSERQLRDFADTAPAMLWETDAGGSCTFLSREWYATTGQSEAEALGLGWTDATHPDDRRRAADAFLAASERRAELRCEYRLRQRDGSYRWALDIGRPRFGPGGTFRGMVGVVIDIHDQKVSEERFAFVRRSSGVGFWYCDLPFDVLEWDERVKAHFHLAPDARVTIDTFYDRIHPDDRGPTRRAIERAIAERKAYDVYYRTVHPGTGAVNMVRAIGRTDYAADGTPVHFDGVTLDMTDQRRAVEALSRSEQRHRALVTATSDVAYRMSADWEELLPLDGRDLVASNAEPIRGWMEKNIPPFEHARIREAIARAVATRQTFEVEHQVIRPDGSPGWTYSRAVPILDADGGGILEWFGTASDVTRRKLAEAEVARVTAESEQRRRLYEAILTATPDFAYIFSLDGRILYANEALTGMWGIGDPVGKTFLEIGYEAWHAELHCREIEEVRATRKPLRGEVPFNGTLGRRIYDYIFVPVFGTDGAVEAVAGTTRDVTDRKGMEDALRDQHRTVETLYAVGAKVAGELDLSKLLQTATDETTQLTGAAFGAFFYNAVDPRGGSYMLYTISGASKEAFDQFPHPQATAAFEATFKGLGVVRLDDVTKDPRFGKIAPFFGMPEGHLPVRSYLAVPVKSRSGDVLGGLVFGHPESGAFTERHEKLVAGVASQAAVAIDNAVLYERLKETDRRKDEFLATLAHELRNPLAPIRTGVQVLKAGASPAEAAETLDSMERQAGHLAHLVEDLMDVARVTSGKIKLRAERFDFREAVANAVEATRPAVQASSHSLETKMPGVALTVDGDSTRLVQVLTNLLTNAAKYTEPGGRIEVAAAKEGDEVVVRVSDTGIGIPPEMLPKVFDMFAQVGSSLERSQGGLGIGLTLVRRLVEMHGGTVSVASAGADRGSTFTVRLPLAAGSDDRTPAAIPRAVPAEGQRPLKVLVVDDNQDGARSLALLLKLSGHDSRTAHTGPEGVAVAKEFFPDVIFLDIGLPGMSGHEVAEELRRDAAFQDTTIVALTGWGSEEDRRKSKEAGCDEHLTKPVEGDEVRRVLAVVRK